MTINDIYFFYVELHFVLFDIENKITHLNPPLKGELLENITHNRNRASIVILYL